MNGVALTFDDGPDPIWTAQLLDLLKRLSMTATFFPIVPRAVSHPELIARMVDEGHTVGLHCVEHVRHSQRDAAWLARDTSDALALLAGLGIEPTLWRTPWGDTAPWTQAIAREHDLEVVGWTVDTHDWAGDSAESMLALTSGALEAGSIVLAHDGIGPGALRQTAEETVRYVELVADLLQRRGVGLQRLERGSLV